MQTSRRRPRNSFCLASHKPPDCVLILVPPNLQSVVCFPGMVSNPCCFLEVCNMQCTITNDLKCRWALLWWHLYSIWFCVSLGKLPHTHVRLHCYHGLNLLEAEARTGGTPQLGEGCKTVEKDLYILIWEWGSLFLPRIYSNPDHWHEFCVKIGSTWMCCVFCREGTKDSQMVTGYQQRWAETSLQTSGWGQVGWPWVKWEKVTWRLLSIPSLISF